MKIKGKKIEIVSAKIHYESFGNRQYKIREIVDCVLLVDGVGKKIYKRCMDTSDLKAKVEAFKSGETITEITI